MIDEEKKGKNYTFIDNIRAISMMFIVMEHSSVFWGVHYNKISNEIIQSVGLQTFKSGTIIFFILAGFLIGDKLTTSNSLAYLKRRANNTIIPWLFWISVMLFLDFLGNYIGYARGHNIGFLQNLPKFFYIEAKGLIFYTSYWFILNFLICIIILLTFKKYIYSLKFGAILYILSAFYAVNLYFGWITTAHTTAIFGFIFYLWLGVQLNKHFHSFKIWINGIKTYKILILCILLLASTMAEGVLLMKLGSNDPFNTLKITNTAYSLVTFLLLYKVSDIPIFSKLKPRSTTFGIYLIHPVIIVYVLPLIFLVLNPYISSKSTISLLDLQFFRFFIAYSLSYLITLLILKKGGKLRWVLGQNMPSDKRQFIAEPLIISPTPTIST